MEEKSNIKEEEGCPEKTKEKMKNVEKREGKIQKTGKGKMRDAQEEER